MSNPQRTGALLIVAASAGYSFLPIFANFAYDAGLTAMDVVTWRFIFATPAIWLVASRFGWQGGETLRRIPLLLMGSIFAVTAMMAFFALERMPASTFVVLVYIYPAFVAVFSLFTGERLPAVGWAALALTIVGIGLTVPDFFSGFSQSDPLAVGASIMNAASYALYFVLSGRLLRGQTALAQASALSITGSLLTLLAVALLNGLAIPSNLTAWLCVIGVGWISTVIPISCIYAGVPKLGAPRAAILSMVEPVIGMTLFALILGEKTQPIQLVGAALILFSAILLQVIGRTPMPEPNSEVLLPLEDSLQPEQSAV
ncbi:MAG: DMT family transporter [bacterium]|nr:DMT family transporter [bacterium]